MKKALVLAITVFTFGAAPSPASHAAAAKEPAFKATDDHVVARVNGRPILRSVLTPLVEKAVRKYGKFATQSGDEDPTLRIEREELDKLIGRELLYQAGMKLPGIEDKIVHWAKADAEYMAAQEAKKEQQKKLAEEARAAREAKEGKPVKNAGQNDAPKQAVGKGQGNAEKDAAQPKQEPVEGATGNHGGLDEALLATKRRTFVINEFLDSKGALTPVIPDEAARKFYEENRANFQRPDMVKASHILVKLEKGAPEKDVEAARKKAEEARAALAAGKRFEELAKEISGCASAARGGELGLVKRGYMPKAFDEVAYKLAPGEMSAPVRTEHGFHIIKVAEQLPAGIRPFDEVKEFIKGFLAMGAREKKYQEVVGELKQAAVIEKSI